MDRRTLMLLTWITAAAAVASALWLALGGTGAKRFGLVPLVLGRPVPVLEASPAPPRVPTVPRGS